MSDQQLKEAIDLYPDEYSAYELSRVLWAELGIIIEIQKINQLRGGK